MRMNADSPTTAGDLVNTLSRQELARIIREYGEEQKANAIAKAISAGTRPGADHQHDSTRTDRFQCISSLSSRRTHPAR